jgi:hypothetical protein
LVVPPVFLNKKKYADTLSVTMFVFGVVVIEVWETDLPVWGFVFALLICVFCLVLRHCALSSRASHLLCFSIRVYSPFECDPGHYEPATWASWAERPHGVDHRIRPSWPPDCDDVVQDMGLYYHDAGDFVHGRIQACPLHEDRTSPDFLLSGCRHHCCWYRTAWCARMDVLQY